MSKIEATHNEEKLQELVLNIETKFDNKLSVFMDTINKETNTKIERINSGIIQRTGNIQSTLADFKIDIQKQVNSYTQTRNNLEENGSNKVNNLSSGIQNIDFTGVAESVAFERNERNEKLLIICEEIKTLRYKIENTELKFTEEISSIVNKLINDIQKTVMANLAESVTLETKERIEKILGINEEIKILKDKTQHLQSLTVQNATIDRNKFQIPSTYKEDGTGNKLGKLEDQLKERDSEISKYKAREIINHQEITNLNVLIKEYQDKIIPLNEMNNRKGRTESSIAASKTNRENNVHESNEYRKIHSQKLDIRMLFDSNGKHIDRKKLWRLDKSEFTRCGTLLDVHKFLVEENDIKSLKYILLNVGVNDLDTTDFAIVFQELENIIETIRCKYPNIKIIISEITPRNDARDKTLQQTVVRLQ